MTTRICSWPLPNGSEKRVYTKTRLQMFRFIYNGPELEQTRHPLANEETNCDERCSATERVKFLVHVTWTNLKIIAGKRSQDSRRRNGRIRFIGNSRAGATGNIRAAGLVGAGLSKKSRGMFGGEGYFICCGGSNILFTLVVATFCLHSPKRLGL